MEHGKKWASSPYAHANAVANPPTKSTANLALQDGTVYEIAVFFAQRQSTGSVLKVTLPPFNLSPSECRLR